MARHPHADDLEPLLKRIGAGSSLNAACKAMGIDQPRTHQWLKADEQRQRAYDEAREQRADGLTEQALSWGAQAIAGQVKPDAARVAIDAIKWATSKMAPRKYGEKFQQEITGAGGGPLVIEVVRFGQGPNGADVIEQVADKPLLNGPGG